MRYCVRRHCWTTTKVDRFSKWTELVTLRTATVETLQKAFKDRIIARFGAAKVLITDNGVQFASRAFKKFLSDTGVKPQLTAPCTPLENPTKRVNRIKKIVISQLGTANEITRREVVRQNAICMQHTDQNFVRSNITQSQRRTKKKDNKKLFNCQTKARVNGRNSPARMGSDNRLIVKPKPERRVSTRETDLLIE